MKQFKWIAVSALATSLWTGEAFAQSLSCEVVLSSAKAGRLDVTKVLLPPEQQRFVQEPGIIYSTWSPPASDPSLALEIHYDARDQDARIGDLSGIDIEFPRSGNIRPEQFSAQVIAEGVEPLHLDRVAAVIGSDRYVVVFDGDRPADRAMGHLLDRGARVRVVISRADNIVQSEMFEGTKMNLVVSGPPEAVMAEVVDTTAIAARNELFAQAERLIKAADPKACAKTR